MWEGDYEIFDIDDIKNLSGYTKITGNLTISLFIDLTRLDGLENLTSIGGNLVIFSNFHGLENVILDSTSLNGLNNLTSVGGNLKIYRMYYLESLEGLESLSFVGGNLEIYGTARLLPDLRGLENLTSIGGGLEISFNDALSSLDGLENLTSIGGDLRIGSTFLAYHGNPTLTSIDLKSLCLISGTLVIGNNDNLCSNLAEDLKDQVLNCPDGGIGGAVYIDDNKDCQ